MIRRRGRPRKFFGETKHTHFEITKDHYEKLNLLGKKYKTRTKWLSHMIEREYRKEFFGKTEKALT